MKPALFDYFVAKTIEEAAALLRQHGEDAKVLAGGQSLVPLMNFQLVRAQVPLIVDINRVAAFRI